MNEVQRKSKLVKTRYKLLFWLSLPALVYGLAYLEMAVEKPEWLQPNPPQWLERVKDQHWR